jgi:hypothetical protein
MGGCNTSPQAPHAVCAYGAHRPPSLPRRRGPSHAPNQRAPPVSAHTVRGPSRAQRAPEARSVSCPAPRGACRRACPGRACPYRPPPTASRHSPTRPSPQAVPKGPQRGRSGRRAARGGRLWRPPAAGRARQRQHGQPWCWGSVPPKTGPRQARAHAALPRRAPGVAEAWRTVLGLGRAVPTAAPVGPPPAAPLEH